MSGTATAPRRPTGAALKRRLLKQGHAELAYWNTRLVPIGARAVLDAIADLVARSPHEGEWRPDSDLEALGPAGWLAVKLRAMGAETEIAGYLAALHRARLVRVADDGAVSLALPAPPAAAPGMEGFAPVARSPGRPPSWMNDAEQAEFKRLHREKYQNYSAMQQLMARQQGKLGGGLMAMTGGGDILASTPADIPADMSTGISNADIEGRPAGQVVPISPALRAEDEEDSRVYSSESSSSSSGTDARERAAISPGISATGISRGEIDQPISTLADQLAADIVRGLDFGHGKSAGAARKVQAWMGLSSRAAELMPEAIRVTLAEHRRQRDQGEDGVRRVGYVRTVLEQLLAADAEHNRLLGIAAPAPVGTSPAAPEPMDPRVAAEPSWAAAPAKVQREIVRILDRLVLPAGGERQRQLSSCATYTPQAFEAVAAMRPEVYEMAGKEPPGLAEQRRTVGGSSD